MDKKKPPENIELWTVLLLPSDYFHDQLTCQFLFLLIVVVEVVVIVVFVDQLIH